MSDAETGERQADAAAPAVRDVLIAEDDTISRRLLEATLVRWGYRVVAVENGEKAWAVLSVPGSPRLVVLDWMMPEMDGLEVCRAVRGLSGMPYSYLVLLTAKGTKEDVSAGLEAGADDYLIKPFEPLELRGRLRVGERALDLEASLARRVAHLQDALAHVKRLQGLLPICMHCHKVRTERNAWQRIEEYLGEHTEAMISHSLCEECLGKHYPAQAQRIRERSE